MGSRAGQKTKIEDCMQLLYWYMTMHMLQVYKQVFIKNVHIHIPAFPS